VIAVGLGVVQLVGEVFKEVHPALRLLRFRWLDWHPCSDAFAIGCNIMIDRANAVSAIRFWDDTPPNQTTNALAFYELDRMEFLRTINAFDIENGAS
jgi:hypothetical protein